MKSISPKTSVQIKKYLESIIQGAINKYKDRSIQKPSSALEYLTRTSSEGDLKPFQAAIVPPEVIRINQFERGLSTRLGNSIEECARLIALEHHQEVHRARDITGTVSCAAWNEIVRQKKRYESASQKKQPKPSLDDMIEAVLNARHSDDLEINKERVDLSVLTHDGIEYLFEIKTPKPNKGQCLGVIEQILRFHLLRGVSRPQVQAYCAMPYNPYGSQKVDYKWSCALKYMPFQDAVVIGNNFWKIIGGDTTYEELLAIYLEVGQEKSKDILDALALEF